MVSFMNRSDYDRAFDGCLQPYSNYGAIRLTAKKS
jgi:hypothetical protein